MTDIFEKFKKPKPVVHGIPCLGHWTENMDGRDFECDYENATFECDSCIITGGKMNPITGKRFRKPNKKKVKI